MKKRSLSLTLLAAMLLTSCGGGSGATDTTTAPTDTTAPSEETTSQFVADDLPEDLNFGGETVKVFIGDYANAFIDDMYSEEATGNRLGDAIYNMIGRVNERLGVKLEYGYETYTWGDLSAFQSKVTQGIMAGDNAFDLFFDVQNYIAQMQDGEYFADLSSFKYINLDKPWYNQTVRDNIATDYVHFISGQYSLANIKHVYSLYFNGDLYSDLGKTESLYDLVDSGKWTLAKL